MEKLALDEDDKERARRYDDKAKGQWNLAKDLGNKSAPPLAAAVRVEGDQQGKHLEPWQRKPMR